MTPQGGKIDPPGVTICPPFTYATGSGGHFHRKWPHFPPQNDEKMGTDMDEIWMA